MDTEFLLHNYAVARNKYKPRKMELLLVAEAPPDTLDRYFYFEDVKRQDSLFLEIMGVLYPTLKQQYLKSGRKTELKEELLATFQDDGFWLMDVSELPLSVLDNKLEDCVPTFLNRIDRAIDKQTPIVLIKANVFDFVYLPLLERGYNVCAERLPFPGSGQQKIFREKFKMVLAQQEKSFE